MVGEERAEGRGAAGDMKGKFIWKSFYLVLFITRKVMLVACCWLFQTKIHTPLLSAGLPSGAVRADRRLSSTGNPQTHGRHCCKDPAGVCPAVPAAR